MPYVSLNHLDLFYEDTEKGDDLPLLFLHGWGTSGRVWGAQLAAFRDEHRVVSLDWRGCGRSDRPSAGNDLNSVVEDLSEAIQILDLHGAVAIGSSIGAIFATELAVRHPEVVSGVVSVDGTAYWASEHMDLETLRGELIEHRAAFIAEWVPQWFGPGTAPALIDWTIRQLLDSSVFIDDHLLWLSTYYPRPELRQLEVPIHYIHGELDAEIPALVAYDCAAVNTGV